MFAVDVHRSLTAELADEAAAFCAGVAGDEAREVLGEDERRALQRRDPDVIGLSVRTEPGDPLAAWAMLRRTGNDQASWALRLVAPGRPEVVRPLLERAEVVLREAGASTLQWWVSDPTEEDDERAIAQGFADRRDLLQLRTPLPLAERAPELELRPFEPGVDEAAWVAVNNAAFAWHPEQSGWTIPLLEAHEAEPWFDPEGFLLHEVDGQLAGFCWTKVHWVGGEPTFGEIYVIAVDPSFGGRGLGRTLTMAGLEHLHELDGCPTGMLYVDASNVRAVGLYEKLGFTTHHVDRSYGRNL